MHQNKSQTQSLAKNALEFVSFFVYEFKSQLNSIVSNTSLLNGELNFDKRDPRIKTLNNIASAACDIQEQLKRIVEVAKLETAGLQLDLETIDMTSLIGDVVDNMSAIFRVKNQTLSTKVITKLPNIRGDSIRIGQILSNLISNASLNAPDGGNIALTAGLYGESVFIRIQDNGPAIPLALYQYMFQPFNNRLKISKDSDKVDLNLALCKHYVELHGGKIEIENIGDQGNAVLVTLPSSR